MEIALVVAIIAVIFVVQTLKIVPQQHAWVVERLGKYDRTLTPVLSFVVPFIERVAYKHSLKEVPLDVRSQVCITKDNTQLQVVGILYFQVTDPMRASYGSSDYIVAITQLAQTTLRSVVGKMELDKTFEERDLINAAVGNLVATSSQDIRRQQEGLPTAAAQAASKDKQSVETAPQLGSGQQPSDNISMAKMELERARMLDQSNDQACMGSIDKTRQLIKG